MVQVLRALLAAALLTAAQLHAAEPSHLLAANEYFDAALSVDREQLIKLTVDEMLRNRPEDRAYIREYEAFMSQVLASPEYRDAKVRVYVQVFSEEELRQLAALVQQPAYRLYSQRFIELSKANRSALLEAVGPRIQQFSESIERMKTVPKK